MAIARVQARQEDHKIRRQGAPWIQEEKKTLKIRQEDKPKAKVQILKYAQLRICKIRIQEEKI